MPTEQPAADLSGTERALFPDLAVADVHAVLDAYARDRLGSGIGRVRFRAGRIDAVWGVDLVDGRAVVIKAHRQPADLLAARAAKDAQRLLGRADYPCPTPLAGPEQTEGRVLSAETLLEGEPPDGRDPAHRRILADGLARHIALLKAHPELLERTGPGPSWCQYHGGPWPEPHDTLVDFRTTPPGYEWLDALGRRAADQVLADRDDAEIVIGHADWYAGNCAVAGGRLTGTFDWELVADPEAVLAGFAASCYAAGSTSGGGLSSPEEAGAFLRDYETARGRPLDEPERRMAAGAATWILAFNARWQVALLAQGLSDDPGQVTALECRQEDYLTPSW